MRIAIAFTITFFLVSCSTAPPPNIRGIEVPSDREISRAVPHPPDAQQYNVPENAERLYPNEELFVCSGMNVTNRPVTNANLKVKNYSRLVVVDGKVPIVTAPANNACVSSGFGPRWGRNHNGLDITSRPASRVFSGGAGVILEAGYNGGYGLAILIDHGSGVYTRYAHLNHVDEGIKKGTRVYYGQPIGLMGKSGHVTGIHLHYEILTGKYQANVRGRGLKPRDPFSFPAWVDPRLQVASR